MVTTYTRPDARLGGGYSSRGNRRFWSTGFTELSEGRSEQRVHQTKIYFRNENPVYSKLKKLLRDTHNLSPCLVGLDFDQSGPAGVKYPEDPPKFETRR